MKNRIIAHADSRGERLDIFLARELGRNRSSVQKMIDEDRVLHNDAAPKKMGQKIKEGDIITISDKASDRTDYAERPFLEIPVVVETDEYVVINKPAGILVHPTEAKESGTVVDWFVRTFPNAMHIGENPLRPGIVHRLDKDASGLLVIAKTQKMFEFLKKQFQERTVEKEYAVLTYGDVALDHGRIDFLIGRGSSGRMAARPKIAMNLKAIETAQDGKEAMTEFFVEKRFARFTLLRVRIHSGRTHQIRVHLFAYGNPVVGDTVYFQKKLKKKNDRQIWRLFLHAQKLSFDAIDGKRVVCEAPLPRELKQYIDCLK